MSEIRRSGERCKRSSRLTYVKVLHIVPVNSLPHDVNYTKRLIDV